MTQEIIGFNEAEILKQLESRFLNCWKEEKAIQWFYRPQNPDSINVDEDFHLLRHFSVDCVSFTRSPNYCAVNACIIRTPLLSAKYYSKMAILLSILDHQRGNLQLLDALNV